MNKVIGQLPNWSKTIDPQFHLNYGSIKTVAVAFMSLSTEVRREEVKAYSDQFCYPRFDLEKASGLYLFLRVIFELPSRHPRDTTQTFGGWLHPSIDEETPYFDLSWPVRVSTDKHSLTIQSFQGYFGKGYDAIGEYNFFSKNFYWRDKKTVEQLIVQ